MFQIALHVQYFGTRSTDLLDLWHQYTLLLPHVGLVETNMCCQRCHIHTCTLHRPSQRDPRPLSFANWSIKPQTRAFINGLTKWLTCNWFNFEMKRKKNIYFKKKKKKRKKCLIDSTRNQTWGSWMQVQWHDYCATKTPTQTDLA